MGEDAIYTLVENVRSLYNVGAIFRTADGAGVARLFLTGITGTPPHREIRKVALGAEERVPWEYHRDSADVVARLKAEKVQIVALETVAEAVVYYDAPYRFPLCLVVGHEFEGVRRKTLAQADLIIKIPMYGSKDSLNVAVAYGIAVYQITRIRNQMRGAA